MTRIGIGISVGNPLYVPGGVAPPALGTPTYVAEAHATASAVTLTVNKPTGTIDGHLMIAAIGVGNTTSTITDPSGWTFLQETLPNGTQRIRTYWKIASSEGASYAWTFSPSVALAGIIATYSDCKSTSPIDGTPTTNTGATGTAIGTGFTTTNNNTMLVMVASTAGGRTFSASDLTEIWDSGALTFGYFHGLQATAGPSGNKNATLSSAAAWGAQLLGIKPSGGV